MKFIIPNYCPPDSFVDNVSHTLRKMGHEVVNLGSMTNSRLTSPYKRIMKEILARVNGDTLSTQEKWLRKNFKAIKPDVVLTLTQPLSEETMAMLRADNIKVVTWWGDTAANMKGKGLLQDGWDLIFIKDAYAAKKLRTVGIEAFHLFEAMNPDWHKPVSQQENNQLIIAGSFYDYRHYLTAKLINSGVPVSLYGGRLPRWASSAIQEKHTGKYIVREEKSRVFGAGLAVLNSTAMSEFDSVNCRAFEVAGTGALQIMEYRPSIENCFEPGKEILVYRSYEELLDLLEFAKKDPGKIKLIREAAAKRAHSEHTYEQRLNIIVQKIKEIH